MLTGGSAGFLIEVDNSTPRLALIMRSPAHSGQDGKADYKRIAALELSQPRFPIHSASKQLMPATLAMICAYNHLNSL